MGRLVAYESRLELARVMLADHDRDARAIAAQPFQLSGPDHGRLRRHVPDFLLVNRAGAVMVVDVKAATKLTDPSVTALFAWTRELAGWRGWGFEAWSGADRRPLDNIAFIAGYRQQAVIAAQLIPAVLSVAREQPSIGAISACICAVRPVRSAHSPARQAEPDCPPAGRNRDASTPNAAAARITGPGISATWAS
jgi:hypothetical protein